MNVNYKFSEVHEAMNRSGSLAKFYFSRDPLRFIAP